MKANPKILIIDDEADMLFVLSQVMTTHGYEVMTATNADDGLDLFNTFQPDLVLLDRIMPVKSGDEVLKEIRINDTRTPVIFLTAKDTTDDLLEGFKFGANDYIKKPFSMKELLARCKSFISLSNQDSEREILKIGKFTLNTVTNEMHFGEEPISLTNMEFKLMKMLVKNKNRQVTTDDIISSLWADADSHSSAKVQVYICRLRKIIQMDPDIKLISLRSIGYKLVEMKK